MAIDYANISKKAEQLIKNAGRSVTLVKSDAVPADPDAPWDGPASGDPNAVEVPAKAVFLQYSSSEVGSVRRRGSGQETEIKLGDKRLLVSAEETVGHNIEEFSYVEDGAARFRIVFVETLQPGDTRLLYDIQARQ